jgi:16S rRNA processing protein RimM
MAGPDKSPETTLVLTKLVLLGRIGAAHGIRGEVRIQSFTDDPTQIAAYSPLQTNRPGLTVTILSARKSKNVIVAKLKDISDRSEVEKLNGVELYVARDQLPDDIDEDDFYQVDLIGLEARLKDGTVLGKVIAIPNYGADDLIEIGNGGKTALYPFTKAIVAAGNIAAGYLIIVPPEEIIVRDEV